MPTIRDGRGVLTVHDMGTPAPGSPSGPVQRLVEPSMVRLPDAQPAHDYMAASRARGAKAGGFVQGATKPPRSPAERLASVRRQQEERAAGEIAAWVAEQKGAPAKPKVKEDPVTRSHDGLTRDERRHAKAERMLAVIRTTSSYAEAALALGVGKHALEMFVSDLRRRGELPADVQVLLSARNPAHAGRPRKNHEDQEASAPATAADELGTPAPPAAETPATPPGPPLQRAVSLPCGPCVHAAVCSIKPDLERDFPPTVERPHPAIHLAILCDHFLEVAS